jgi:hypothetical protein
VFLPNERQRRKKNKCGDREQIQNVIPAAHENPVLCFSQNTVNRKISGTQQL